MAGSNPRRGRRGRRLLLFIVQKTALALLVTVAIHSAQAQADMSPHFDVASIRLTNLNTDDDSTSDHVEISPGGRLTMRSIRLNSCVKWAYGVQDAQIVDRVGLTAERYDIVAQAAGPTADKNLKLMMQALLADRFKLVLHREKKELAIYKLVVAKSGPKFRKSEGAGNREGNLEIRRTRVGVAAEKISMSEFADYLSGEVQGPVQDMTGLTGSFNLALDLRPYAANLSTPVTISSLILEAMRDQLGLQLQSQKGLTDVLVIDHVERPTAN